MKTEVNTREEYDALLKHGIDALCDDRYHLEMGLRIAIQKEKFGRNDDVGNAKFYHYCLTHFPMVCENCGKPIRHPWATNVSHILTRGAHPRLSHDCRNINILCGMSFCLGTQDHEIQTENVVRGEKRKND